MATILNENMHKLQTPLVIILLLFVLRYPLLFFGQMEIIPSEFAYVIFLCATYLCSGIFIYLNRNKLEQYNITNSSILIFLFTPILAIIMGNDYDPTLWIRFLMSIIFGLFMFSKRKYILKVNKTSAPTTIINIILTLVLCIVVPILIHIMNGAPKIDLGIYKEKKY